MTKIQAFKFKHLKHEHKRNIVIIFLNKDDYIYFENDKDETDEGESFDGYKIFFKKNLIEGNCYCCYHLFFLCFQYLDCLVLI